MFFVYSEVLTTALESLNGVSVGATNINNLRYADYTVLIAKDAEDLQKLVNQLDKVSREFVIEINIKKTEIDFRDLKELNSQIGQPRLVGNSMTNRLDPIVIRLLLSKRICENGGIAELTVSVLGR